MSLNTNTLRKIADGLLEASVVGSFTKVGIGARRRLEDWQKIDADMTGQTVLITGATSGIGEATASGLLGLGASVHLTSRSQARADEAAEKLNSQEPRGTAIGHELDTADFESIAAMVATVGSFSTGLDVLIHNAGALTSDYNANEQGTELTLASHLIGPYLLTRDLRPHLNTGARVLFMSSGGMYTQGLNVEEIEMTEDNYRGAVAYARAKRGQVELVAHLGPDWAPGVIMHAMHPGWVDTPGVDAGLPGFGKIMSPLLRDAEQGADTMIWLAATGGEGASGQFWLDRSTRGTSYLPGTGTTPSERQKLLDWLELQTLPASIG